jgi:hypothetical protein
VALFLLATLLAGSEAGSTKRTLAERMGQVVDWSTRHVLYPQGASLTALALSERDPRAYWNYLRIVMAANAARAQAAAAPGRQSKKSQASQTDWSVSLGAAGLAPNMFPAKFSFNVNAAPNCADDYVVFTINTAPTASQANIAAFNNLYSGAGGLCGGTPTSLWAYQVSTVALRTSPVLSLDGTKVAFVDGANPAVFHVLTPTAGEGTVGGPNTPTAGEIVNVRLTTGADTNSSPFIDYANDVAYVGTNNGRIFKITGVFKGFPTLAGAPWPLLAGTSQLTEPVVDFGTGNIFVGSANGNLYGFTPAGAAVASSPLLVGDGLTNGGIKDAPTVDVVNGLLYAATGGNGARTNAVLIQTSTSSFATVRTANIGPADVAPIHDGQFNDAYFSAGVNNIGTTSEWFFYVCGVNASNAPVLNRVGFSASRQMNTTVDATSISLSGNAREQCSPLTEFKNGVDRLFLSLRTLHVVEAFDISTSTTPTTSAGPLTEAGGTSGIIVDNTSAAIQASSIYFSTLGASPNCASGGINHRCAVKLTQSALQ